MPAPPRLLAFNLARLFPGENPRLIEATRCFASRRPKTSLGIAQLSVSI